MIFCDSNGNLHKDNCIESISREVQRSRGGSGSLIGALTCLRLGLALDLGLGLGFGLGLGPARKEKWHNPSGFWVCFRPMMIL